MKSTLVIAFLTLISINLNAASSTYSKKSAAFPNETIKGLGIYLGYDTSDTLNIKNGKNKDIDRSFFFSTQYDFKPIQTGMYFSGALSYTPSREISNYYGAEISNISPSALFNLVLTSKIAANVGMNYSFPSLTGASGMSAKSDFGYQFGGTYFTTQNINIDLTYKITRIKLSSDYFSSAAEMAGLNLGARYMF